MQTQVQKWGNSLGIRISKDIAGKLKIKTGAIINLEISNNHLILTPEISELELLLNNITDSNCHQEEFRDDAIEGKELW